MTDESNILYGGSEPPIIDDQSKSFGEVILKRLQSHNEAVSFVSFLYGFVHSIFLMNLNFVY